MRTSSLSIVPAKQETEGGNAAAIQQQRKGTKRLKTHELIQRKNAQDTSILSTPILR